MSDVYHNPEKFGLTILADVDLGRDYEFDMYVLWGSKDGAVYFGHDSGCSCPSPFEEYTKLSDLTRVFSLEELKELTEETDLWDAFVEFRKPFSANQ